MERRLIYHMCRRDEWAAAERSGVYRGSSQDTEGFIHFSTAAQIRASARKHRWGQEDLVLVTVDAERLGAALRWEPSREGAVFPHLYGALPLNTVLGVERLPLGMEGEHVFPRLREPRRPRALFDAALPLLRALPPEAAHRATILALRAGVAPLRIAADPPSLGITLWNRRFPNPIGLAAGFDKNAEVPDAMLRFGFGFVETGTVTPQPQPGNPKPRLFRLAEDGALINRLGFNNQGLDAVRVRLAARRGRAGMVGANLGKNKDSTDAIADYVAGVRTLAAFAGYLVVNVSSPNTPGLRDLQRKASLLSLIAALKSVRAGAVPVDPPPILLKIAPDLSEDERAEIAEAALEAGVDGLVISNTTVGRPAELRSRYAREAGGLSGKPLFAASTALVGVMRRLTRGRIPLVGVGGIASGADAYAKIRAGASLVQLYTALVYEGSGLVSRIKRDLAGFLARDGFASIAEAVGADAPLPS